MQANMPTETVSFDAAELGAMMREMRENLGHELDTVASDLRIRLVYLEAIEAGRLNDLPGNAYVSGFLRSYSDFLGLEGSEIVRRFKMAGAEISSQPQLHLPSPVEEGRLPTASILLVAAVIAAAAYGGWYYLSAAGKGPVETVANLPNELSGMVDGAKNQTAAKQVAPTSSSAAPETSSSATPTVPAADQPEAATAAAESAATPAQPAESIPETPAPTETAAANATAPVAEIASTIVSTPAAAPEIPKPAVPAAAVPERTASPAVPVPAPAETAAVTPPKAPAPVSRPVVSETTSSPPRAEAPAAPAVETPGPSAPVVATTAPVKTETVRTASVAPNPNPSAAPSSDAATGTSGNSSGQAAGGVRIVVRATADSYVAVRTGENEPLFSQLMRPGDSYEVPSGADLMLETGNAGGLQITIGGKRAPSLGPVGQIRRNIPLDAERLLRGLN